MDTKSTKKIIEKDIDKMNTEFARGKIYIEGIIREQEAIIKMCESEVIKINIEISTLKKELEPYTLHKDLDTKFHTLKTEYEKHIMDRNSLQQAITVAEESISSAKLNII